MHTLHWAFAFILFLSSFSAPALSAPAVDVKSYEQLLLAIRQVREETRRTIEQTILRAKVEEAWKTGDLIEEHLRENHATRVYGDHVTHRLAAQLGMSYSLLNRMRNFARAYPGGVPARKLSWNDYILLSRVSDEKKREALAAAAEKENWTYARLAREVRAWNAKEGAVDKLPEIPLPKTGIYPWVTIHGKKYYNLGFTTYLEKARVPEAELPPGKGAGEENFFAYDAEVVRVVDGDTFHARINAGFGVIVSRRVRLRRVDAPEINTEEGSEARAFLEKLLMSDQGRILLQTHGVDQHGRVLADVWVKKSSAQSSQNNANLSSAESVNRSSPNDFIGDPNNYMPVDQAMLDVDLALPMENY